MGLGQGYLYAMNSKQAVKTNNIGQKSPGVVITRKAKNKLLAFVFFE